MCVNALDVPSSILISRPLNMKNNINEISQAPGFISKGVNSHDSNKLSAEKRGGLLASGCNRPATQRRLSRAVGHKPMEDMISLPKCTQRDSLSE